MDIYRNITELESDCRGLLEWANGMRVLRINQSAVQSQLIDRLIDTAVFTDELDLKRLLNRLIPAIALNLGIIPASLFGLYEAPIQSGPVYNRKTVPAINIRGLTYDVARAVFRAARKNKVGVFIFEIARSEIGYTKQEPAEYAACVLAAAIKESYRGPVFLQGDHYQVSSKKYAVDASAEIGALKNLIERSIEAGFYNIDIDASTLVDLSKPTVAAQQETNARVTAELTGYIRQRQPAGVVISVGGEIGEVGKQNSTPDELRAFMKQYRSFLAPGRPGISKISVQTGTKHGGVVLPDGSLAEVEIDFGVLKTLSQIARQEFGLAGAVQHGASTLPESAFSKFPENETAEIHLATGFQNIIYDSAHFPSSLLKEINKYLLTHHSDERKTTDTEEQFFYKTRKKAFGPFKRLMWEMPRENIEAITGTLEDKFSFLFRQLGVTETVDLVKSFTPAGIVTPPPPTPSCYGDG
ncbi:MAG: class II fructose-bisphosphate aldolase [Planctomycetota bacterium]